MFEEEGASYACQSPAPSTKSVFVGQFKSDKLRSFSWLDHISIRWVAQLILLYHVSTSLDAAYLFSFFDCTKLSGMFLEAGWNGVSKRALMRDWVGCVLWWREVLGRCLKCLECSCWPHCALCTLSLCTVLILAPPLCPSPFCWRDVLAFQSYLRHPPVLTIFVPPICQCPSTTDVPIYINATSSEAFNLAIFNSRSDPSPYIDLQSSCDVLRAIVADQCWDCSLQNCHYGIPLCLRLNLLKYIVSTMLHTLLTRTILCWHGKSSQSFGDFLSLKVVSLFVVICTVHCSVQLYAGHLKLKQLESFMPSLPIYLAIISQVTFA